MKKSIITLGIIGLFIPMSIKAGSINLSCNETKVIKGGSTTCTLSGTSNEEISALSAKVSTSGGVNISNINISSGWQGDGSGGSIDLYTENNKSGGFGIATITINVNGEGSLSTSGVTFSDANFSESGVPGKTVNIAIKEEEKEKPKPVVTEETKKTTPNNQDENAQQQKKSNDASLKELKISGESIEFNPNTLSYYIEVSRDIEKIDIIAKPNDTNASIKIPDNLSLKDGDNKFIIEVTAQDGTKKEYEINIKRLNKTLSTDSSLKSISISGHNIDFNTEIYTYNIGNIKESNLKIDAVANDANATVKIYGNKSIGKNDSIVIEVEAEDKTKTEYIIYANNTQNQNTPLIILIIILWIVLIISISFNIYLYIKSNKTKRKK